MPAAVVNASLRLPVDLDVWIGQKAKQEVRSKNAQIVVILKDAMEKETATSATN